MTYEYLATRDISLEKLMDGDKIIRIEKPFPHLVAENFLDRGTGDALLQWFETNAIWAPRNIQDFYETYDINFSKSPLPNHLTIIRSKEFLAFIRNVIEECFYCTLEERVDVSAHKLIAGNRIRAHTDFGEVKQSHRLLIQINRGWVPSQGGILILLDEESPADISPEQKYYLPVHCSLVGFEMAPNSFHAVSKVEYGVRYTLCYSFYSRS